MAGNVLTLPQRLSSSQQRRSLFAILIIIELVILVYIGTRMIQIEPIVDRVEVTGNIETTYYLEGDFFTRNEIIGDPLLLVLITVGMLLPFISQVLQQILSVFTRILNFRILSPFYHEGKLSSWRTEIFQGF